MRLFNTTIQIGSKKWKVPNHITVSQFEAVQALGLESPWARMLFISQLTGCPIEELKALSAQDLELAFTAATSAMKSLEKPLEYRGAIDFEELTFGQFIDLDILTHEGLDNHMTQAISIIWDKPQEIVADDALYKYITGLGLWAEKRQQIYSQYSQFFGLDNPGAEDPEAEGADIRRSWYQAVITLAGEDFSKMNTVVDRPVIECLNFLAWMKDMARKREAQIRQQELKLKAKSR